MQVAVVNRRAQERYGAFVGAMDVAGEALLVVDKLIDAADETRAAGTWTVATPDELQGYRIAAMDALERLRTAAKKYEVELVSRDWRV